ncbi:diguanylate cyclase domain-containing protein [Pelomicrobium sp. G1]|uniref:diguanylate cyclase domain-containing protein n=1 Tax=unclassified Pelomicrobium TaxID=2815318 RepID=UPI003F76321E
MAADNTTAAQNLIYDRVSVDRVGLLLRTTPLAALVSLCNAALVVYVLWGSLPKIALLGWFAALALAFVVRASLMIAFNRVRPGPSRIGRWERRIIAVMGIIGLCWGVLGSALFPFSNPVYQVLVVCTIAGMSAGALIPASPVYPAYAVYLAGAVAPLATTLLLLGGEVFAPMGFLALVYLTALLVFGYQSHRTLVESLWLKYQRDELVRQLTEAHRQTEQANRQLQREIVERRRAEEVERQDKQRLMLHVLNSPLAVVEWDERFRVVAWNPSAARVFGYTEPEALGRPLHELVIGTPDAQQRMGALWKNLVYRTGGDRVEQENITKDGRQILCEWYNTPLMDHDGRMIGIASLVQDVTDRRLREAEIIHKAYHDQLTGLPNRVLLCDRLAVKQVQARRRNLKVAVLFVDLDGFKRVNDQYGHEAGDHVLKCLAERLKSLVRQEDTVARYGGDEFVVALSGVSKVEDAEAVAAKIVLVLSEPVTYRGIQLRVTPSIGISFYPDHGNSLDELFSTADSAMYKAKQAGGSRHYVLAL